MEKCGAWPTLINTKYKADFPYKTTGYPVSVWLIVDYAMDARVSLGYRWGILGISMRYLGVTGDILGISWPIIHGNSWGYMWDIWRVLQQPTANNPVF